MRPSLHWRSCGRLVIVPNSLRDAINKKLDEALAKCPEAEVRS